MSILNYLGGLFATAPADSERSFEAAAPKLSLDGILELLKKSRSTSEAREAALLLREHVGEQRFHNSSSHSQRHLTEPTSAVRSALTQLRSSRTPYEAERSGKELFESVARTPLDSGLVASPATGVKPSATVVADPPPAAAGSVPSRAVPLAGEVLDKVSVLVVEDDPNYRQLLVTTLERSGATVAATGSIDEAVSLIAKQSPDVVLSDIELRGESGYELMERINREYPKIPVLAISGHLQSMTTLGDAGFPFFFPKEPGVLRDIVKTIARMPAVMGTPRLSIGANSPRKGSNVEPADSQGDPAPSNRRKRPAGQ